LDVQNVKDKVLLRATGVGGANFSILEKKT